MPKANKKEQKIEQLYNKALLSIETGQYDYAISILKSVLAIDPDYIRALDAIKLAKTRKLQKLSLPSQKIRSIVFMLQAFFYENFKKYEKALDKYESLFALMRPPLVMLVHLGDVYLANRMVESATAAYKVVLQSDTGNIHSLRKLGKIYIEKSKISEAKAIYDRLSNLASSDRIVMKEVNDAYAMITIDRGQWEEEVSFRQKTKTADETAEGGEKPEEKRETVVLEDINERLRIANESIEKDPHNVDLHKELAKLLLEKGNTNEAISEYRKIASIDPKDIQTHETIAELYRRVGDVKKAISEYEKLAEFFPDRADILKTLAELYQEQDASEKAIEICQKIIKITPEDPNAHETLGRLYEQTRFFSEAILQYEKTLALDPERVKIEEGLGNLYIRDGKTAKAIEKFQNLIKKDKAGFDTYKVLGGLYTKEHMLDKAKEIYQKILKTNPDEPLAKAKLDEIEAIELDKKAEGIGNEISEYEKALAADRDNPELKNKLNEARVTRLALHIKALEDRIKVEPDNTEFHYKLGAAYRERGFFDKALKELQIAVKNEVRSVASLHLMGLCFEEKNMLDIAAKQLEKASERLDTMNDEKKAILYDLGRLYEKMNQGQKAFDKYKEIYEVDIGYKDISEKIEKAYPK